MKHPDDFTDEFSYATARALSDKIGRGGDSPGMDDLRPLTVAERKQAETAIASVLLTMSGESFGAVWSELHRMARGEYLQ